MKIKGLGYMFQLILVFIFVLSSGCMVQRNDMSKSKEALQYPVEWYESCLFKIGNDDAIIGTKKQLKDLLSMNWYEKIELSTPNDPNKFINVCNCEQFFEIEQKKYNLKRAYEWNAYQGLATMCHAVKAIIDAKPASVSFLRYIQLNAKHPDIFPIEMAFILSESERKRVILLQKKGGRWSEASPIKSVKLISDSHAVYYDTSGGIQEIEILGYGDFNHDGIDDVLLLVENSVEEGSYFASSLFILTKMSLHAKYEVIMEYVVSQ